MTTAEDGAKRGAYIGAEVAAALIRVTPRRLRQLSTEGWIKKEGHGQYTVRGVVHGYLDFQDDQIKRAQKNATEHRIRDARAREIELRTAREEGALIPTDEAVAYTQAIVGELISHMNGLPAQITRNLDERRKIEAMLDRIRKKVAEVIAEHGPVYAGGPPADLANGEDDGE